ncbi:MAG: efflux RND transporter permease subunit [Candidatus Sabulitectum sp.]|nr:efflux RND transporter permease subunit [Candidatus Sabulitectum sp.]
MNISELVVKRKITFLMIFIFMGSAGIFALTQLGLDYFPKVDVGQIMIVTILPGGAPSEVENLVTKVIEDAVSGVEGVTSVESSSGNSTSGITVIVSPSADIEVVERDIKEAVELIKSDLPEQAMNPVINAMESSMKPLIILGISSDNLNSGELRQLVTDEIEPVLSRVSGVASCNISGGEVRQINVAVNPVLLGERNIPLSQVYGVLKSVQGNQPGGDIDSEGTEIYISVKSGFTSLEQIGEVVIGISNGIPVHLRDVADVTDGNRDQSSASRLDGENSVLLILRKSGDANTVNTCTLLEEQIAETAVNYSGTLNVEMVYSQKDFVLDSTKSLLMTGVQAILLAAAVLMFFLGSAVNAGIVSISMPLSFISTFAAMYLFGVNLNIMSLAGLSISIGMIVDNSVVVLENIHRRRRHGESREDGARHGASQVAMAVAASTLTTVAVFIPMLFVKGMTGQIFRDLSITIACALFISLFLAMTLVPLLASRSKNLIKKHSDRSIATKIEKGLRKLDLKYEQLLIYCTAHRVKALIPVVLLFSISMFMFRFIPTSFLPDIQEGIIDVSISLPTGTNLAQTDSIARQLEDSLSAVFLPGDLGHLVIDVGKAEGMGAMFGSDATCRVVMSFYLVPEQERNTGVAYYASSMRSILSSTPGIRYAVKTGDPIGNEFPIQINLFGSDLDTLKALGDYVRDNLDLIPGTTGEVSSLEDWFTQIDYIPDEGVLSLRGLSRAQLASEITLGMLGMNVTKLSDQGVDVDVNLRYAERYRTSREAVAALTVSGAPLDFWGTFTTTLSPNKIGRLDRSRVVSVFCKLDGRSLGAVAGDVQVMMDSLDTGGARWEITGDVTDQKESFGSMGLAILVAVMLVYMVMAAQFESLLEPFILVFEIPLALIGVVWILFLTGTTMGMTALVGILMLIGIVVNNGIVLVDFANGLRRESDITARQAIIKAGRVRLKPILMTASTTILALVPLSLGGSSSAALWAPMARTVIGGMLMATPLTLVVLPVLYVMLDGWHRKKIGSNPKLSSQA